MGGGRTGEKEANRAMRLRRWGGGLGKRGLVHGARCAERLEGAPGAPQQRG